MLKPLLPGKWPDPPLLLVLVGLPGCGKTSFAQRLGSTFGGQDNSSITRAYGKRKKWKWFALFGEEFPQVRVLLPWQIGLFWWVGPIWLVCRIGNCGQLNDHQCNLKETFMDVSCFVGHSHYQTLQGILKPRTPKMIQNSTCFSQQCFVC